MIESYVIVWWNAVYWREGC